MGLAGRVAIPRLHRGARGEIGRPVEMNRHTELLARVPDRIPPRIGQVRLAPRRFARQIHAPVAAFDGAFDLASDLARLPQPGDAGYWQIAVANLGPRRDKGGVSRARRATKSATGRTS